MKVDIANRGQIQVPLVSIIMTTYNAEKHIDESLQSALAQDIGNLELLCVDGHSTDQTIKIIRAYGERDSRVKLVFQERAGIGAAKNHGIEHACGEYITFLDADDFYVESTALKRMYETCEHEGVSICGAFRSTLFMDGRVEDEPLHRNDCTSDMKNVRLKYKNRPYDYHFHSYLYKREMIINSDARFAEVKAYDDTHFFIRAMIQAKEFCVVPVELYRYRCGPPYDWDMERANDAIVALTDQLRLTKAENLAVLHWLTLQRINYEYGSIFVKNILAGDFELLKNLVVANQEIDPDMIRQTEENLPSEKWYLEPMMHRRYVDIPLRMVNTPCSPPYIIEPLWKIMHPSINQGTPETGMDELKASSTILKDKPVVEKMVSIIGKISNLYLMRKMRGGIQCIKDHGIAYTICHVHRKIKNYFL